MSETSPTSDQPERTAAPVTWEDARQSRAALLRHARDLGERLRVKPTGLPVPRNMRLVTLRQHPANGETKSPPLVSGHLILGYEYGEPTKHRGRHCEVFILADRGYFTQAGDIIIATGMTVSAPGFGGSGNGWHPESWSVAGPEPRDDYVRWGEEYRCPESPEAFISEDQQLQKGLDIVERAYFGTPEQQ